MHRTRFVLGFTALFLAWGIVVTAEQGRGGSPKPLRTTTSAKPVKTTKPQSIPKTMKPAAAPKVAKAGKTTHASPVKVAKTAKPVAVKVAKTEKAAPVKVAKAEKPAKSAGKDDKKAATKTTAPAATATPGAVPLTPVQEKLTKNTNLAAKLTARLPAGTDLMAASAGFRNLGQFVAAVNVSSNLKIPFDQLKTKMVTDGKSLGQAIQALKPVASATIEAQHAEYDARGMIADSEQQPQVSASTTTTSKTKTKAKKPAQ
jgi:hypothetical protein